ncbi:hypothetical protein [Serinibacter salmoneus]|uniref:Uncharacterized protein n=1 Tax=Serinibacter salmoneus TaxID=556530 RepID=A0A2A9D407_9MICO|nr:hypothetical protein [Serinibacter salmoneus]PFG20692.1 hypothetical protein ATL40_2302 [Serinibacter salmoneus]
MTAGHECSRAQRSPARALAGALATPLVLALLTGCSSYSELAGDPAAHSEPGYPAYSGDTGTTETGTGGAETIAPSSTGAPGQESSSSQPTARSEGEEPRPTGSRSPDPSADPTPLPSAGPDPGITTAPTATPSATAGTTPAPTPTPTSAVRALLRVDAWDPVCGSPFSPPAPGNRVELAVTSLTSAHATLWVEATLTSGYDTVLADERYAARTVLVHDGAIVAVGASATPTTAVPVAPGDSLVLPASLDLAQPCPGATAQPERVGADAPAGDDGAGGGTGEGSGEGAGSERDSAPSTPPASGEPSAQATRALAPGEYATVVVVEVVRDGAPVVAAVSSPAPVTIP